MINHSLENLEEGFYAKRLDGYTALIIRVSSLKEIYIVSDSFGRHLSLRDWFKLSDCFYDILNPEAEELAVLKIMLGDGSFELAGETINLIKNNDLGHRRVCEESTNYYRILAFGGDPCDEV